MTSKRVIAVDAMGGDVGPSVTVPASCLFLKKHPEINIALVGDEEILKKELASCPKQSQSRISIVHADQVVENDDTIACALREKKKSSMRLAIDLVKEGRADACVSAGNTGALMAISRFVLKTIPDIDRPAILTCLPTLYEDKGFYMLDLGANIDSSPNNLLQFAIMGSVVVSTLDGVVEPRVALLNIGEEHHKGNEVIRQAAELLSRTPEINYVGFVEPNNCFLGEVDVVVCDGFAGNVALKSIEGTVKLVKKFIRDAYDSSWYTKLLAFFSKPVFAHFRESMSTSRRNGAHMIGLNGVVVKSHGGASVKGFANAIEISYYEMQSALPQRIAERVSSIIQSTDEK